MTLNATARRLSHFLKSARTLTFIAGTMLHEVR